MKDKKQGLRIYLLKIVIQTEQLGKTPEVFEMISDEDQETNQWIWIACGEEYFRPTALTKLWILKEDPEKWI